ncbi:hypothetical protein [Halobacteriovorax sp.]|uniref:hypothetical protein n=1 Tax=Halobacteriovorax sp. TaxID=2020862 RepID=UPI00356A403A
MKFISNLIFLISFSTSASTPLILITYEGEDKESMIQIESVMNNKFQVGKELYKIEYGKCKKSDSVATHICIDKNMDVKVISRNDEIMNEMLGVYWK